MNRVFAAMNAAVASILRSPVHRLLSGSVMLLSYRGRRSGRMHTIPVNYRRDGRRILCGCDFRWWRNIAGGADVSMLLQGQTVRGYARPVENDPVRAEAGFKKLRPRTYAAAKRRNAVLIEIDIGAQV